MTLHLCWWYCSYGTEWCQLWLARQGSGLFGRLFEIYVVPEAPPHLFMATVESRAFTGCGKEKAMEQLRSHYNRGNKDNERFNSQLLPVDRSSVGRKETERNFILGRVWRQKLQGTRADASLN